MGQNIYYDAKQYLEFVETRDGGWYWILHHDGAETQGGANHTTKQGAYDDFVEVVATGAKVISTLPKVP